MSGPATIASIIILLTATFTWVAWMGRRRNAATPHRLVSARAVLPVSVEQAFDLLTDPTVRERRFRKSFADEDAEVVQWAVHEGLVTAVVETVDDNGLRYIATTQDREVVPPRLLRRDIQQHVRRGDEPPAEVFYVAEVITVKPRGPASAVIRAGGRFGVAGPDPTRRRPVTFADGGRRELRKRLKRHSQLTIKSIEAELGRAE